MEDGDCTCIADVLLVRKYGRKSLGKKLLIKKRDSILTFVHPEKWIDLRASRFTKLIHQAYGSMIDKDNLFNPNHQHNCIEFKELFRAIKHLLEIEDWKEENDRLMRCNPYLASLNDARKRSLSSANNNNRAATTAVGAARINRGEHSTISSSSSSSSSPSQSLSMHFNQMSGLDNLPSIELERIIGHVKNTNKIEFFFKWKNCSKITSGDYSLAIMYLAEFKQYLLKSLD